MQLPITIINPQKKITLRRILPVPGQVLVQPGDRVQPLSVVARAEVSNHYRIIDVARQLGRRHVDMDEVLKVKPGQTVKKNQTVAVLRQGPLLQRTVKTPVAGTVTLFGPGWVLIETRRSTIELPAFINGTVQRVLGNRGVVLEGTGAMIEVACGFGGEAIGRLRRLVNSPYDALTAEAIGEDVSDSIVLGGRTLDEEALHKAEAWKVRGIIVGSIDASLLALDPPSSVCVVATEGFGEMAMSAYTFGILTSLSRKEVSIRGQTPNLSLMPDGQITDEPPIILATDPPNARQVITGQSPPDKLEPVTVGSRVRIIHGEHFGLSGTVENIPETPQPTPAGIAALGAYIRLGNSVAFVPWQNLQQIR
ncbi:MAG TPA: hypothetical protein PKE64_22570 [Anaerolineae bacterium]|nr:hypothetical protein [Anaerolineae bacterium]